VRMLKNMARYITSSRYRWSIARIYMAKRIRSWHQRGFIPKSTAFNLRKELRLDEASAYLTDFTVHLSIKPFMKVVQWGIFPILWGTGLINNAAFVILLLIGGSIGRTLYTSYRFVQAMMSNQRKPWVALLVGLLPIVGNAAYPLQLVHSSAEKTGGISRFILYDVASTMGRAVPIWGGADSRTEHCFNRMSRYVVIRWSLLFGPKNSTA